MESSSDVGTETPQELSQATTVDSHKERNFSITINKRGTHNISLIRWVATTSSIINFFNSKYFQLHQHQLRY